MKTQFITGMLVCCILISCEKQDKPNDEKKINLTKTTEQIIAADNQFGFDLFKRVLANDPSAGNVFISPTSVALALAMTYNGAEGDTRTAMQETLRKQGLTAEELNQSYKSLVEALVSLDPKVLLEIANSIWYRSDLQVLPDFINVNQTCYNAEVTSMVFDNLAKDIINGWVATKTHDKIKEVLDEIPPDAVMYLINAIYFKGIWKSEFDKEKTADLPFYIKEGSVIQVPSMQQQDTFNYYSNEQFSAIELPYGDSHFSMVVMLPATGKETGELAAELDSESWNTLLKGFTKKEVVLHLPRFRFEYGKLLNQDLADMGMGIAFTDEADFSGIDPGRDLMISRVIHKTFVEVNEEGTEAAAVTVVEIIETSYPGPEGPVYMFIDRPFLFFIKEKDTGAILFIGRVNDPSASK
jgi:serpin B